jgi:hypothetical protein
MKLIAQAQNVIGNITPPDAVAPLANQPGAQGTSALISALLSLALNAAGIVFLFMIIWSGYQWLTSGGDKEAINKSKGRLITSFIGIAIIMLSAVIATTVGKIFGFTVFAP